MLRKSVMGSPVPPVPPNSIASAIRSLPDGGKVSSAFRDAACASLRMSRTRGGAECEALGVVFDEISDEARRILILDLLAAAGTPQAQSVMRLLLARRSLHAQLCATFGTFIQRLGFVERPDQLTLRFLTNIYARVDVRSPGLRTVCAYTLGASISRAHLWGLVVPAVRAADLLRRDLLLARTIADKCMLIMALGKTGLEDHAP